FDERKSRSTRTTTRHGEVSYFWELGHFVLLLNVLKFATSFHIVVLILITGSNRAITTTSTAPASTSSISGSKSRTNKSSWRQVRRSSPSAMVISTCSSVFDSSATAIISTTSSGNCPQAAKGAASD